MALALVATAYLALALGRPADVFWSPDQAGRMLQVLALLQGRYDLAIAYPGRWLDPELLFRPYLFSYVYRDAIHLPWPMAWALPSAILYGALGGPGLVLLPVGGGVLAAWGAGRLAERLAPGTGWLAVLLSGLATPLLIYSSLFWDHAPAAGLFTAGLLLVLRGPGSWRAGPLLAGACFGLALAWRNEVCLYLAALALAAGPSLVRERAWAAVVGLVTGAGGVLAPIGLYNWLTTGALYARSNGLTSSVGQALENLQRYAPRLVPELLVGRNEFGLALPEAARWAPALGLLLLALALALDHRGQTASGRSGVAARAVGLRAVGLILAGSATAVLFVSPAPGTVHGFLIAAPFLAVTLAAPEGPAATRTGRWLLAFAGLALALYALAALTMHVRGPAGGGAEWGPRFLLPLYPPLAALAAVALRGVWQQGRRLEAGAAQALVALAIGFQLAGLAEIDHVLPQFREFGGLIDSLPPDPVVVGINLPIRYSPAILQRRDVFCTETPAALGRWADRALGAGEREFWYVDQRPLPAAWLLPGSAPPELAEARAGPLRAVRYQTAAVRAALRSDGPDGDTCGYRLLE